jgi:hypothetical protein
MDHRVQHLASEIISLTVADPGVTTAGVKNRLPSWLLAELGYDIDRLADDVIGRLVKGNIIFRHGVTLWPVSEEV